MIIIIVGMTLFIVGRKFQQALDLWNKWKDTLAALPGIEADARRGRRVFIKVAVVAAIILWAINNMGRFS